MKPLVANNLADARTAAGFATPGEFARRAGIDAGFYGRIERGEILPTAEEFRRLIGALGITDPAALKALYNFLGLHFMGFHQSITTAGDAKPVDLSAFYDPQAETGRLFVSRDEQVWLDHHKRPDRAVDVYVNMSCGTARVPHLILDAAAILEELGVSFTAVAGRQFCCGAYYRTSGNDEASTRMRQASLSRAVSWGADTVIHNCTKCEMVFKDAQRRADALHTPEAPVTHVQLFHFLADRVTDPSTSIPWRRETPRRVLIHGHADDAPVLAAARDNAARILARVPGVTVVGLLGETGVDKYCDNSGRRAPQPGTVAEVHALRRELADIAEARGADTISCTHQRCHQTWSYFASERLAIRHPLSIMAEAFGRAHPDRYQAAAQLGDPEAIVGQTRRVWESWGMPEEKALETARSLFDPVYGVGAEACVGGCGPGGGCASDQELVPIDVLSGKVGFATPR